MLSHRGHRPLSGGTNQRLSKVPNPPAIYLSTLEPSGVSGTHIPDLLSPNLLSPGLACSSCWAGQGCLPLTEGLVHRQPLFFTCCGSLLLVSWKLVRQ